MARHRAPAQRRGYGRTRAVLAGAVVLGIGASITLASWTDDEFASGSFTASKFVPENKTLAPAAGAATSDS